MPRIIGIVLIKNEDRFLEPVLRNIAEFCDDVLIFNDHSVDGTGSILHALAQEFRHFRLIDVDDPMDTQRHVAAYAGTETWAFGVDGDEIYDPLGLRNMRARIEAGEFADAWCLYGHAFHCLDIDFERGKANGFCTPASRSMTKLYNMRILAAWEGRTQRLHAEPRFKRGYGVKNSVRLCDKEAWGEADFRCLHTCFMQRSYGNFDEKTGVRLDDGTLIRPFVRRNPGAVDRDLPAANWKNKHYARGPILTVDATPFLSGFPAIRAICASAAGRIAANPPRAPKRSRRRVAEMAARLIRSKLPGGRS